MTSADYLLASLDGIDATSFTNDERTMVRDALFKALRKVQSPWDIAWEQNWVNGATNAAIRTLIDAGVFQKWAEDGWKPKTCAEIAALTGADVQLIRTSNTSLNLAALTQDIGRMMRHLATQHLILENAEKDTYEPTPWARNHVSDLSFSSTYIGFYHELNNPMFRTLPLYLQETGFKNPSDVRNGNLQYWLGKDADLFQYIGTNSKLTEHFNDAMECHSKYNLAPWTEVFPTDTIISNAKEDRPLIVDIGGSKGHDLEKFRLRHPDLPENSLVLQDLPEILKDVFPNKAISVQPYDFFTPQPVEGARIYFMHNVLHDWTDEKAIEILCIVANAMEKGYSRLLIHESFISSQRPAAQVTTSDLTMMACLSSKERSEDDWRQLISDSGLSLVQIWKSVRSIDSIIEVERV